MNLLMMTGQMEMMAVMDKAVTILQKRLVLMTVRGSSRCLSIPEGDSPNESQWRRMAPCSSRAHTEPEGACGGSSCAKAVQAREFEGSGLQGLKDLDLGVLLFRCLGCRM